jgi:hypothetical protein
MTDKPLFVETPLPSPITEFTVQVLSNFEGADHFASGTGVIVAPYLAMSARHVLDDHWRRHHGKPMPMEEENAGGFSFILAQIVGSTVNLWTVSRLWVSGETDIVFLHLTPYSEGASKYVFRRPTMDMLPPKTGEKIHAFGYSGSSIEVGGPKNLTVRHNPSTTHGNVVEVFHQLRDPVTMPFPCFRTNARFDGGMSGGPVFNEAGLLCGMICSSYPPFEPDEDHASYAVSLWPAMAIPLDLDLLTRSAVDRYPTYDLISKGLLAAKNGERVKILPHTDGSGGWGMSIDVPPENL